MTSDFPPRDYRQKPRIAELAPQDRERVRAKVSFRKPDAVDPVAAPAAPPSAGAPAARADAPPAPAKAIAPAAETSWEDGAGWYDRMIGDDGDDFYKRLILPAVERRLAAKPGDHVLDVACGNGVFGRVLAARGVKSTGVDASPALVKAAQGRAGSHERHLLGDVRELAAVLPKAQFDHATMIMCLQDLDPIDHVLSGAAALVRPGGRLVVVMTHPAFRIPRRSAWGWDEEKRQQFRRIDTYITPIKVPIRLHPGQESNHVHTSSFHRPISTYLDALGAAGWGVIGSDELSSHRRGTRGARSAAEDLILREIPLFLVLAAVKLPA